jgi:hypothetical protein
VTPDFIVLMARNTWRWVMHGQELTSWDVAMDCVWEPLDPVLGVWRVFHAPIEDEL